MVMPPTSSYSIGSTEQSGCEWILKNTFVECAAAATEGLVLRRVQSAPALTDSQGPNVEAAPICIDTDDEEETSMEVVWPCTPDHVLGSHCRRRGLVSGDASTACPTPTGSTSSDEQTFPAFFPMGAPTSSWTGSEFGSEVWTGSEASPCSEPICGLYESMPYYPSFQAFDGAAASMPYVITSTHQHPEQVPTGSACLSTTPVSDTRPVAGKAESADEATTPRVEEEDRSIFIAQLQETLQCAEYTWLFKFPPGVKVLQWSYAEKREARLYFRAILHFLCNGVAHHVSGDWSLSKKDARQNAAEVGLALIRGLQLEQDGSAAVACTDLSNVQPGHSTKAARAAKGDCLSRFDGYLASRPAARGSTLQWCNYRSESEQWHAMLTMRMLGVEHTFSGPALHSREEAQLELAKRVLWYLGAEGFSGFYVPNRRALLSSRCKVPMPPQEWKAASPCVRED